MDFYHLSYNEAESITSYTIATFFLQLEITFRDILEAAHADVYSLKVLLLPLDNSEHSPSLEHIP